MNSKTRTDHSKQPAQPEARPGRNALARFANWFARRFGEHEQRLHALRVYDRERVDSRHSR
jgi:hypothetical protein